MATQKNNAAQEAAQKALAAAKQKKAAEKKKVEHNITHVGGTTTTTEELLEATRKNALPYRIGAIVLWVLAIVFEVFAILIFVHKVDFSFTVENPGWTIAWVVCLVLDLVCVIIGSQLWKKGNHLDPASEKNKVKFWLNNNLGVFVSVLAFLPFIIFVLTDKKASKQSKTIAAIAAVVALLVAGLTSYDWNPISQEEMLENANIETVYWTASGTVYHAYSDCSHLNNTVDLFSGDSATAIENGKTRMCKTCEARIAREAEAAGDAITDTSTDKTDTSSETDTDTGVEVVTEAPADGE